MPHPPVHRSPGFRRLLPQILASAMGVIVLWAAAPPEVLGQQKVLDVGVLSPIPAERAARVVAAPGLVDERALGTMPHPPRLHAASGDRAISASARRRQDALDVHYYHLSLNLDIDRDPELIGRVRVQGQAVASLDTLDLDLAASMEVISVLGRDGRSVPFVRGSLNSADKLFIVPDTPLAAGDLVTVDIVYQGNPAWDGARGGYQSGRRNGGDPYIWTLSEPYGSLEWWPTEDHPADKADSVRVTITVPDDMTAASNGVLQSEQPAGNGTVTFDWLHRHPIATYLVSVAAGDYDRVVQTYIRPPDLVAEFGTAHVPIEQYAYKDSPAVEGVGPTSGWRLTGHAMAIQEHWFGAYPFADEKYGNAHVTFRGGMEHQTLSSMGNIGIELIAHELAHQWFGDAVTPASWQDLWLNEGFATLGEMLTFEADPAFLAVRDVLFDIYYERARTARGTLVLSDTTNALDMFAHGRVYAKGWMVLRMIRSRIGDTLFREVLRGWAARPDVQYGTASTRQFQETVESITGQDWSVFFNQWVFEGTGEPKFSLGWQDVSGDGTFTVRLHVNQVQESIASNVETFEVRLPIWVDTGEVIYQVLVDIDEREETVDVALPARPLAVHLDPERWILRGETSIVSDTEKMLPERDPLIVEVAPHPAHGDIRARITSTGSTGQSANVSLHDVTGKRWWHADVVLNGGEQMVIIPTPAAGRYLLRVRNGHHVDEQLVVVRSR